jgi:hypothetical protein
MDITNNKIYWSTNATDWDTPLSEMYRETEEADQSVEEVYSEGDRPLERILAPYRPSRTEPAAPIWDVTTSAGRAGLLSALNSSQQILSQTDHSITVEYWFRGYDDSKGAIRKVADSVQDYEAAQTARQGRQVGAQRFKVIALRTATGFSFLPVVAGIVFAAMGSYDLSLLLEGAGLGVTALLAYQLPNAGKPLPQVEKASDEEFALIYQRFPIAANERTTAVIRGWVEEDLQDRPGLITPTIKLLENAAERARNGTTQ